MNRYGTLDVTKRAAPVWANRSGEPFLLRGATVLDVRTELDSEAAYALVPPSMRPGIPPCGVVSVTRVNDSPVGPFGLAELRVGVRVGAMVSFFVVGAVCDSREAGSLLTERLGLPITMGDVSMVDLYHEVSAQVVVNGSVILQVRLTHRRVLPGTSLNTPSLVALARERAGGPLVLINTPLKFAYSQAEGGRQAIELLDGPGFGAGNDFCPTFAMSATIGTAEITFSPSDCCLDPIIPGEQSLRPLAA